MKKLSGRQRGIFALIVVLCLTLLILFTLSVYNNIRSDAVEQTKDYGESVAANIRYSLIHTEDLTVILEDLYKEYGVVFLIDFESICERLSDDDDAISAIYFAPDGRISYAYPKKKNADAIGFNILESEALSEKANLAIDTGEVTVSGPNDLAMGGQGFIARKPVLVDGRFYGFTVVVLDWEMFKNKLISEISGTGTKYKFAVASDDPDVITDEYGYILNSGDSDLSHEICIDIEVPNDVWHLYVQPVSGFISFHSVAWIIGGGFLTVFLMLVYVYSRMTQTSERIYNAEHDELTGLLTRQAFVHRVEELFKNNPNKQYDVIAADIENFKMFNSIFGESKGNELLCYLAGEYSKLVNGICARYGGDQFVAIFGAIDDINFDIVNGHVNHIAENAPIRNFTVKYGYYGKIDRSLSVIEIADRALMAARSIKNDYTRNVENYDGQVSRLLQRNRILEASFEDAFEAGEFKVWYQPKFDAKTEKLAGAEALVRWIQEDGTVIPPGAFIHLFEEDGRISKIDEYVFKTVCDNIKHWNEQGIKTPPISINLSRSSLFREGVIDTYKRIVEETGLCKELLPIEITESAELQNNQIKDLTEKLKTAGFTLHMDDFGSGFSSLASLNILPFDVVKLDKSLIDFIGDPGGEEIIKHTIALAHFKNMKVVAEGVERREQLDFLKSSDCDYIQGYYYSQPKPFDTFEEYIRDFAE